MNRRGFLFGLGAALVASPAIVKSGELMPVKLWTETLYGDGLHDDAPAIEAMIRGDRVIGWDNDAMASVYTRTADRARMAKGAMGMLEKA